MFIAALFTVARTWKQPRCPLADYWIRKFWYIYTMEYYSVIKRNTFESVLMKWMNLEPIIQSVVSQKEKHQYCINAYIWDFGEGNGNPLQYSCLENPMDRGPGGLQSMRSLRVRHDWTTSLSLFTFLHWRRKCNPLQCSCLENPRDGRAWWAAIYGVAQSQTQLKRLSSSSSILLISVILLFNSVH